MRRQIRSLCLVAGILASPAAAFAQDFVVAASNAASVAPGQLLNAETQLSLQAGETLTLIGPAGPIDVSGPYDGALLAATGGQAEGSSALADLVKRRKRLRSVGASRGLGAAATETVFQLLADSAYCVDGAPPRLFLTPAKTDRIVSLVSADGGTAEILWPANESIVDWPGEAPFTSGVSYTVKVGDIDLPGGFALKAAPSGESDAERINAYLQSGCLSQAEAAMASASGG